MPLRAARPLFMRLESEGIAVPKLLDELGISLDDVVAPSGTCSSSTYFELWRRGLALSRDPALPLHVAEMADLRSIGSFAFETEYLAVQLFAQSETLGQGLDRLCRYLPLGHPVTRLTMIDKGDVVTVRNETIGTVEPVHAVGMWVTSLIVQGVRSLPKKPVAPLEVRFAGPSQAAAEYSNRFGSRVRFNAGEDAIDLKRADLAVPLVTSRPSLALVLERRAEAQKQTADTFINDVKAIIRDDLETGPSAERTAARLKVSLRTLNRRLDRHGASHRALLDEVRMSLAAHHLSRSDVAVAEVALLLGFSETSAFHRAFKRWSGKSPTEYRRGTTS
nr:hypothetical protein [uncultured bacterium]